MALKIWTFLLVMSLPAAEHGRGFGSLAAVLNSIDYYEIQQKLRSHDSNDDGQRTWSSVIMPSHWSGHRIDRRSAPKIANRNHYVASSGAPSPDGRCVARVQSALGDMMMPAGSTVIKNGNRRHTAMPHSFGFMDLSGYALHQRLRTAPGAEMYVTGMRAKVLPPHDAATAASSQGIGDTGTGDGSWALVDGCRYDPLGNTLEARMRFGRTLMVSGSVRLLYGAGGNRGAAGSLAGETGCDMTLRLRPRAGLGFTAMPLTMPEKSPPNRLTATPTMTIRTTAKFIDPEPVDDPAAAYISVHSYNCVGGAAGFPGNREQPAASSDRFEQFLSSEDSGGGGGGGGGGGAGGGGGSGGGGSDELLTGGSGEGDIEIDMNDDNGDGSDGGGESTEVGDKRSSGHSSSEDATPPNNLFSPAGFVTPLAPNPEPRLRRIQYKKRPFQHPLLTVAAGANNHHQPTQDQLLMEMEDVFVRGVRSLLAKHLERTLKPVLKDSLMANMGYTVSYG